VFYPAALNPGPVLVDFRILASSLHITPFEDELCGSFFISDSVIFCVALLEQNDLLENN
jgi:hypothetical protein